MSISRECLLESEIGGLVQMHHLACAKQETDTKVNDLSLPAFSETMRSMEHSPTSTKGVELDNS